MFGDRAAGHRRRVRRERLGALLAVVTAAVLLPVGAATAAPTGPDLIASQTPPAGPALYDEAVLADEPVAYYRMDETSGPTAADSSGNGRSGTYQTGVTLGTPGALLDDPSTAVTGPSSGPALVATDAGLPDDAEERTIEVWARQQASGSEFVGYGDFFVRPLGAGSIRVVMDGIDLDVPSTTDMTQHAWHHYVVTVTAAGLVSVYVDGQLAGSDSNPSLDTTRDGSFRVGNPYGTFDEAAVYDTALSAERVAEHWFRGQTRDDTDRCPTTGELDVDDPYGLEVMADAPSAFFRLGDAPQDVDERVAYDVAGGCHHGAIGHGMEVGPPAVEGTAGSVGHPAPSTESWVMAASGPWLPSPSAVTVEAWYRGGDALHQRPLLRYGPVFELATNGSRVIRLIALTSPVGHVDITLPHSQYDDGWHHVAVTYDGATATLYFDGIMVGSRAMGSSATGKLQVGNRGAVDEVAVYPSVLTPDRISAHWAGVDGHAGAPCAMAGGGYGGTVVADAPAIYLPLGERAVDGGARVAVDRSGNCRHGAFNPAGTATAGVLVGSTDGAVRAPTSETQGWGALARTDWRTGATDPVTVEVWARRGAGDQYRDIFAFGTLKLVVQGTSLLRLIQGSTTIGDLPTPVPAHDGEWHHYVVAYDGATAVVYFDGVEVGRRAVAAVATGGTFGVSILGSVDEAAAYPAALSAAAVRRHWAAAGAIATSSCAPGTGPYATSVIDDGPHAYYRMGERTIDPTARVAVDRSGGCNHGAIALTTSATAGALPWSADGAVTRSTAGASLVAPALPDGVPTPATTVEGWVRRTAVNQAIIRYGDRFRLSTNNSSSTLRLNWNGTSGQADFPVPTLMADDRWHHVAVVYDGSAITVWLDGVRVGRSAVTLTSTTASPLVVEGTGGVDEVAVFPSALSGASIRQRWSIGASATGVACSPDPLSGHAQAVVDDGPIRYWRLGDVDAGGSGQVAFESTGGCANGAFERSTTAVAGALAGDGDGGVSIADVTTGCSSSPCRVAASASVDGLPSGTTPLTVELWADATASYRFLWEYGNRIGVEIVSATQVRVHRPGGSYTATMTATTSGWHHWALAYDGSVARLYRDGVLVGTTPAGWTLGTVPADSELRIGGGPGSYDELAVFDRALSAGEIADRVANGARVDTTTTLAGPPGPWLSDRPLDLTATVTSGGATATGTVELRDGATVLDTATLDGSGQAQLTATLDEGPHALTAVYLGSGTHSSSRSAPLERPVLLGYDTETAVTVSPSPAVVGQAATATVVVAEAEPVPGEPAGDVEVLVDGEVVGEASVEAGGQVLIPLPALAPDEYAVTARYLGSGDHLGSESDPFPHEVERGSVAVTADVPATIPWSAPLVVAVDVAAVAPATGTPTGTVTVEVDGEPAGSASLVDGAATVVVEDLDVGIHEVEVAYGGSSIFAAGAADETVTVSPASASVAVSADPSPSAEGADVDVTATLAPVAPATATPEGFVRIYDGIRLLGSVEAVDGVATVSTDDLERGPHVLRAVLVASDRWATATGTATHHVRTGSTTTVEPIADTVAGEDAVLSVRVTSADLDGPVPTGTVTVLDEADAEVGAATLDGSGRAEVVVEGLSVGEEDLVVRYVGDDRHAGSTSAAETATVTKAASHVTLTATPNPSAVDADVVLVATVAAERPGAGTPTGSVAFVAEGDPTPLATAPIGLGGTATATASFDAVGSARLTAVYDGDGSFTGRTSAVVTHHVGPGTTLDLVADPATAAYGEGVELTATVASPAGTPAGTVTFSSGDLELGDQELDSSGVAVLVVDDLPAGEHDVVAEFAGAGFGPSSDEIAVEVAPAATDLVVEVAPGPTSTYGSAVTATVAITSSTVDPEELVGIVTVSVDGTPVGTATAVDGEASVPVEDLDVGEHVVLASYAGRSDGDVAPSSDTVDHEVTEAPTTVVLTAPAAPLAPGEVVELEATVERTTAGGTEDPTGTVTFTATGVGSLGTVALVDGVAVLATDDLTTVGPWEITADYAGDTRHLPSASEPEVWAVKPAATVTVTPPGAATDLGDPAAFAVTVAPATSGPTPTGEVELRAQDGPVLAVATVDGSGAAVLAVDLLPGGENALVVSYEGDATYAAATSAPLSHTVTEGPSALALDVAPDPVSAGSPVAVVVTVTGPSPEIRPTGTVRFGLPSGGIEDVALDPDGRAVVRLDGLAIGTHEVEATYLGDRSHDPSPIETAEVDVVAGPDIGITVTPTSGAEDLEVTAQVTGDPGAATLTWDFGDGSTVTGPSATPTYRHTYTQPGLYTVTLTAVAGGATATATARVEVGEDDPLVAVAGPDQTVAEGVASLFDGRTSAPLPAIESWSWDLGDGTTSTDPTFGHVYAEAGTYGVRLTVSGGGRTATDEVTVTVVDVAPDQGLHVTVEGEAGPIEGADVLVIDSATQQFRGATDVTGQTVLAGLADSTYSVYAIAAGHRPALVTATVEDGYGTATVTLDAGERGITDIVSRQLTGEEILAAGLDPNDPANSHVWEVEIWLNFQKVVLEPAGGLNGDDGFLINTEGFVSLTCQPGECEIDLPDGVLSGRIEGLEDDRPTLIWMVLPARAQWLKEFFEVQMVIQNLTDPVFAFEDAAARIDLPPGLSLAPLTEPQDRVIELDDIPGGSSGTARWLVRGDDAGRHDVGTTYTASLYPFGTGVEMEGWAPEGVTVVGADALSMVVTADDVALKHSPYQATVELTNTSTIPIHNLTFDLFDEGTQGFIYQPRQQHRFVAATLAPGQSLTADVVMVPHAFSGQESTEVIGDLDLEDSFVSTVGDTQAQPATIAEQDHIPLDMRPVLCAAGFATDEDGVCGRAEPGDPRTPQQPLGQVALTWEPTGGPYRVYRSDSPKDPFPTEPLVETTATGFRYELTPGQNGFYAVTTVGPDGEEMFHNAVEVAAGTRTSSTIQLFVECNVGAPTDLRILYADSWYPLQDFRVVINPDEEGAFGEDDVLAGGRLTDMAGEVVVPVPPTLFTTPGDHLVEHTGVDGEVYPAARVWVQVRNTQDDMWSQAVQAEVFPDCDHDIATIPAAQTFGSSCMTVEYKASAGVGAGNPTLHSENLSRCASDPVNTATGSLVTQAVDLTLPGAGEGFELARTYNSADDTVGPLGRGWTHPYDETLAFPEADVIVHRAGDGQQMVFVQEAVDRGPGDWFVNPTTGAEIERRPTTEPCGCRYVLHRTGMTFAHFDDDGHLVRVFDRNDDGLTFTTDGSGRVLTATDDGDRTVTFTYTGDRLTMVTLPSGRHVTYGYADGLLATVVDVRGGETTYRYEGGRLVEENSPNRQRVHLTAYDPVTGRAVRQEDGTGAVTTFAWDPVTETSTMTDSVGAVWVEDYEGNVLRSTTDPLGQRWTYEYDASFNLTRVTEPDGGHRTMTYDSDHHVVRSQGPAPLSLVDTYTYDDHGNRTSWRAADGSLMTYSYDSLGRPDGIDGPGRADATSWVDLEGDVDWTEDALGRRTTYEHDVHGNLTLECTPLLSCTEKEYDAHGDLRRVIGPRGTAAGGVPADHDVLFEYDEAGNRTKETDPLGHVATYVYDANGNVLVAEEPDGRTVVRTYDSADQVLTESIEGAPPTTFEYDGRGLLTERTSPEGRVTTWTYDAAGRMDSMTDGEGATWTYGYDHRDQPTWVRDPLGGLTRVEYDAAGRPVRQIDPTGAVTTTTYDRLGRVTRVTDPTGATTRTTYDAEGHVATVEGPAGGVTAYQYDDTGNLVRTTAPTGEVTETEYDIDGRAKAVVGPLAFVAGGVREEHTTHLGLDAAGNVETVTDPLDRVTTSTYDALGRVTTEVAPGGRTTAYTYDEVGRLATVTTPDDEVTEWVHDDAGDLVRRIQPDGGETSYTYDDDHLQLTETDALDRTWRIAYDGAGRVEHTWDAIATATGSGAPPTTTSTYDARGLLTLLDVTDPGTPDVRQAYDAAGRPTSVTDGAGVETRRYDRAGRVVETRRGTDVLAYAYDAAGRPRSTIYPDGTVVEQTFDRSGRTRTVATAGERTTYGYDAAGRLDGVSLPNGVDETYEYDRLDRMTSSVVMSGATAVTSQVRTFDPVDGDVASETTPAGTVTYDHDDRGRLTDVCVGTCATDPTTTYLYDEAGNRVEEQASGATAVEASYDAADQVEAHFPATGAPEALVHDGNGNVVDDGLRTYRYDALGRLVEVGVSDGAAGGSITGRVQEAWGFEYVEGVVVRAFSRGREVASATTDGSGSFTLSGLPAGEYVLWFDTTDGDELVSGWYDASSSSSDLTTDPEAAEPIELGAGEAVEIAATLVPQHRTSVLSGTVTDPDGDPIQGARVTTASITSAYLADAVDPTGVPVSGEVVQRAVRVRALVGGEWAGGERRAVRAGTPVTVGVEVANTGMAPLDDVEVTFPDVVLDCPTDDGDDVITQLAVDQTVTCTATLTPLSGTHLGVAEVSTGGERSTDRVGYVGYGACTITGTSGDDSLGGTPGDDVICGLGGADMLDGGDGDDVLVGGAGNDWLEGGDGADILLDGPDGPPTSDVLVGGPGADLLQGTGGRDFLTGGGSPGPTGGGDDLIFGGDGDDVMTASDDGSTMIGGTGANEMTGGGGFDLMYSHGVGGFLDGNGHEDWLIAEAPVGLTGGDGDDLLVVLGDGDSNLQGGAGEDVLIGGDGDNWIDTGGDGDLAIGGGGVDNVNAGPLDSIIEDDYVATTTTDAEGEWEMRVPAGIYTMATTADGFLGEMYSDTTWLGDVDGLPVWEISAGVATVELAPDPGWVAPPEDPAPDLGEPGEVVARYTYDAAGNRVTTTTSAGTTRSTWDTSSGLARLVMTRGAQGDRTVVWGPSAPLSVREPGEDPVFLHTDAIGSVTAVTDAEGDVVGRGAYEPFGELRWADEGDGPLVEGSDLFGFAGEQYDAETGLYYLRARYYDPVWGRFTQPDPIGPAPGAGHESTYLYAGGSPLAYVDPTGLAKERAERVAAHDAAIRAGDGPNLLEQAVAFVNAPVSPAMAVELALGFTPLGAVWDAGKAVAAALRGDWGEAALYTLAIAPGVSELTKGLKLARTFRYADEAADASRAVSRNVDEIADVGADIRRTADDLPTIRPRGTGTDGVPISTADDVASTGGIDGRGTASSRSVDPNRVRFSQTSVNGVGEIEKSMGANGWVGSPIDVVRMNDGGLTTLDNTRVLAARRAGIPVQANIRAFDDPLPGGDFADRFRHRRNGIPVTWGEAVTNRLANQSARYRNRWPSGSPFTGWDGS